MTDEIIQLPLTTHAERVRDMLIMRQHDNKLITGTGSEGREKQIVNEENILLELNKRMLEYKNSGALCPGFERCILQSISDYQNVLTLLQKFSKQDDKLVIEVNYSLPVAKMGEKLIYAHEDGIITFSW